MVSLMAVMMVVMMVDAKADSMAEMSGLLAVTMVDWTVLMTAD